MHLIPRTDFLYIPLARSAPCSTTYQHALRQGLGCRVRTWQGRAAWALCLPHVLCGSGLFALPPLSACFEEFAAHIGRAHLRILCSLACEQPIVCPANTLSQRGIALFAVQPRPFLFAKGFTHSLIALEGVCPLSSRSLVELIDATLSACTGSFIRLALL